MKFCSILNLRTLTMCFAASAAFTANAADMTTRAAEQNGLYAGVGLGANGFGTGAIVASKSSTAFKLFGGYQFAENFGVEAGYVALGSLKELGAPTLNDSVRARSLYFAGTTRLPLSDSFTLTGKAGLSFGRITASSATAATDLVTGSKRSFMGGIGLEYSLGRNAALSLDYEGFGKLSNKVSGRAITLGARYNF